MGGRRPVWASSHVGLLRPLNEDGCLVGDWRSTGPIASWRGEFAADGGWAVVADGMGGHEAGDVASRVVLDAISGHIRTVASAHEVLSVERQLVSSLAQFPQPRPGLSP